MITDEMAARFHLPPLKDYTHTESDYYHSFLCASDYVAAKLSEAAYLHEQTEDYTDVIEARKYARHKINELKDGA